MAHSIVSGIVCAYHPFGIGIVDARYVVQVGIGAAFVGNKGPGTCILPPAQNRLDRELKAISPGLS
jgi:hypothetical protein